MPQFDPTSFASQIFWLLIVVIATFLLAKFIIFPNFEKIFKLRSNQLSQDLSLAEKYRLESEKINEECNDILFEAKERAKKVLDLAEQSIKEKEFSENQKLNEELRLRFLETEKEVIFFKNNQGAEQMKDLKINSTRIFIKNILEEDIEEDKLLKLIEEVEKTIKIRKN